MNELLYTMHVDKVGNVFEVIVNDTLYYTRMAAQLATSKSEYLLRPLKALRELISWSLPNTKSRPICTLVVERADWLPTHFTFEKNKANEIVSTSFLGPFIDVNIMDDM